MSFAESLRGPLVGPGEDKTSGKPAGGLFSGLPENGDPLPDIDLPPAEAGLTPVSRLNASHKTAQEQPDIPAGLFVNPYAPDDLVMTATSKTTAVESESNEAPVPASSPEDAAMQAEFLWPLAWKDRSGVRKSLRSPIRPKRQTMPLRKTPHPRKTWLTAALWQRKTRFQVPRKLLRSPPQSLLPLMQPRKKRRTR